MIELSEMLKKLGYAVVFGFIGLIAGIWTADLIHKLILMNNIERVTTTYISLIIIIAVTIAASVLGFSKGKNLLENPS